MMDEKERAKVEQFCNHIKTRDPWLWGDTAKYILANIDYTARALLIESGNEYFVTCYLKDGRLVELQKRETGFGCKWESPEEKANRENQWPNGEINNVLARFCS
jgi:hypothetical protein